MNIINSRGALDAVGRISAATGASAVLAPSPQRVTVDAVQNAQLAMEAGRRALPGKRADMIARLRLEVHGGTYTPDAERIASELIAERDVRTQIQRLMR